MCKIELTREDYEKLINKLATTESELLHARKLLEASKRSGWLKRFLGSVAVVVMIVGFVGAAALGEMVGGTIFWNGNKYRRQVLDVQLGYITGVADTFSIVAAFEASGKKISYIPFKNFIRGMSNDQIQAIVSRFMQANPQHWNNAMPDIVFGAVYEAKGPSQR